MDAFPNLFSSIQIGNLTLKNRLVLAPLGINMATPDGFLAPRQERFYLEIARGGVGLITFEGTSVNATRRAANASQPGIYDDKHIPGLQKLVERVHAEGTPIFLQIHDGLVSTQRKPEDLSSEEIKSITDDFVKAAWRAKQAGFDGVEIHMVHRGTFAEFLSKRANQRRDEYGRNVDGRVKFPLETLQAIKEKVGKDYPVVCRILGDEFLLGGNTLKESTVIAALLEKNGADAISVSAGGRVSSQDKAITKTLPDEYSYWRAWPLFDWPDAMNAYLSEGIKKAVRIPVAIAGKIGTPEVAEEVLREKKADLVAMGRALVADPWLPKKVLEDNWDAVVKCRYCRYCRRLVRSGKSLDCILWK